MFRMIAILGLFAMGSTSAVADDFRQQRINQLALDCATADQLVVCLGKSGLEFMPTEDEIQIASKMLHERAIGLCLDFPKTAHSACLAEMGASPEVVEAHRYGATDAAGYAAQVMIIFLLCWGLWYVNHVYQHRLRNKEDRYAPQ